MNKPTREQAREFWEGYGLQVVHIEGSFAIKEHWEIHNKYEESVWDGINLSESIDLDNLFKYAVPKFSDWGIKQNLGSGYIYAWVWDGKNRGISVDETDPALALFWALWEVKNENKN